MSEFYSYQQPQPSFIEPPQSFVDAQFFAKATVDVFDFDQTDLASKTAFEFAHYGQSPTDVDAPHPEQFDAELDSSLAAYDTDLFNIPQTYLDPSSDIFRQWRSDTPTRGVPSTFTVSSESTYDSYSDNLSSYQSPSSVYNAEGIDADMNRILSGMFSGNDNSSLYGGASDYQPRSSHASVSVGGLPSATFPSTYPRGSASDYEPSPYRRVPSSAASDYMPQSANRYPVQATVSPAIVSTPLSVPSQASAMSTSIKPESAGNDPKKKYACPSCSRSFARAFNLKTHIATHDPNRAKPYACLHKSCGRAFSRKHDLRRHLVAIHHAETNPGSSSVEAVGVERGQRNRCDGCGKSWVGGDHAQACDCEDVK